LKVSVIFSEGWNYYMKQSEQSKTQTI